MESKEAYKAASAFGEAGEAQDPQAVSPTSRGTLDAVFGLDVLGWAWNPDSPDKIVAVELVVDGEPTARCLAGEFRHDLSVSNIGDGRHAFRLRLPSVFCDGAEHQLIVRLADTGEALNGSPLTFRTTKLLEGGVDMPAGPVLTGWVRYVDGGERPLGVTLFDNGEAVATVVADEPYEGGGKGRFRIPLPRQSLVSELHEFTVFVTEPPYLVAEFCTTKSATFPVESDTESGGEVAPIRLRDDKYAGSIDWVGATLIKGWCVNESSRAELPELELLVEGRRAATLRPIHFRPEIDERYPGSGLSGFHVHIGAELARKVLSQIDLAAKHAGELRIDVRPLRAGVPLRVGDGVHPFLEVADLKLIADARYYKARDPFYVRFERMKAAASSVKDRGEVPDVKVVAFYLPQFHPFPENDEWWGEGFTEWTNVASAKPLFEGHYQPHLPADLGFYDLRVPEISERQAQLAREFGVYGFCYHFYWFGGRPLMDLPIKRMLESGKPDFPFCICWANEPWSRRWDGSENEVLVAQEHDLESDEKLILELIPYFKDPRYIRVNGAPLLLIYRVGLMSEPRELLRRWRLIAADHGIPDLHIVMAETFGAKEPYAHGCDAAVSFPPHDVKASEIPPRFHDSEDFEFTGKIFDYRDVVTHDIARPSPGYLRYGGVMPSWDNTPRRGGAGHVFHNSSPEYYEYWLSSAIERARRDLPEGHRIVFINAWNEWGEGAHLEPDRQNGHRWLEATRRAIEGDSDFNGAMTTLELSSRTMNSPTFDRAMSAIRFHLAALKRSNEYLVKQYSSSARFVSPRTGVWVVQDDFPLDEVNWRGGSKRFSIDRVNQYAADSFFGDIPLSRLQSVEILGWFHAEKLRGTSLLYLLAQSEANRFVCLIRRRVHREDVNAEHPDLKGAAVGFELEVSMSSLPPASYHLDLVGTDGNLWEGVHCPFRFLII